MHQTLQRSGEVIHRNQSRSTRIPAPVAFQLFKVIEGTFLSGTANVTYTCIISSRHRLKALFFNLRPFQNLNFGLHEIQSRLLLAIRILVDAHRRIAFKIDQCPVALRISIFSVLRTAFDSPLQGHIPDLPLSQPHRDIPHRPIRREAGHPEPTSLPVILWPVSDTHSVRDARHLACLDEFRVGAEAADEGHARDLRRARGGEGAGERRRGGGAEGVAGGGEEERHLEGWQGVFEGWLGGWEE